MIRDKVRLHRLNQRALNDVAKEEAMYWRLRREALHAKLLGKGTPNIQNIDLSESALLSGELDKEIWRPESDCERKRKSCLQLKKLQIFFYLSKLQSVG